MGLAFAFAFGRAVTFGLGFAFFGLGFAFFGLGFALDRAFTFAFALPFFCFAFGLMPPGYTRPRCSCRREPSGEAP